jgi:cytochrome P450
MASFSRDSSDRVLSAADARVWAVRGRLEQAAIAWPQRILDFNRVSAMSVLRRRCPVVRVGPGPVVVSRRADVLAVLADDETFPTAYVEGLAGGFVLGLAGEAYDRHRRALDAALLEKDLDALEARARELAEECVARGGRDGLPVGRRLVRPVLTGMVNEYLGVTGPHPETLLEWTRAIFQDIFLNNYRMPVTRERGEDAARQFRESVAASVSRRLGEHHRRDDVMSRLLTRLEDSEDDCLSEAEIVDNLVGLAIGWLWHGAKTAIIAVDELMERPDVLASATAAARAQDVVALRRILWEVLRFRPVQVGLPRTCARDTTLGEGTPYATEVPAGAFVLAGTHSAMWDDLEVPDPRRFDATRPDEQYLIFGHGRHRCLGEAIMRRQLPAMLMPLLAKKGLARVSGSRGRLSWVGPSPNDLWVQYSH